MTKIYVAMVDEGVDVWRPVEARHINGNIYQITEQNDASDLEKWRFNYGETVACKMITVSEGRILAAVEKVDSP